MGGQVITGEISASVDTTPFELVSLLLPYDSPRPPGAMEITNGNTPQGMREYIPGGTVDEPPADEPAIVSERKDG